MRILIIGGFFLLVSCSYLSDEAIIPESLVKETADYALYYSSDVIPPKALLFIPGGLVDPYVYVCWIEELVRRDSSIAVVLLKYTSNLAITNQGKAFKVMEKFPEVESWIIGGHSLGGVVACSVAHMEQEGVEALILMASWSREATDLSAWNGQVLSFIASGDSLATRDEVFANSRYLPEGIEINSLQALEIVKGKTYYYEIEGGNHAGFGCYGEQEGDGAALIDPEAQQAEFLSIVIDFIGGI